MANMTYRGLTIRIGGDTTNLQRAIKEVNSYAGVMQSQLRRVNTALRFDPASVDLLTAKMTQLGEKSILAGAKAEILESHLKGLPKDVLDKLEQDTGQLGAQAALASEKYNKLNEQIAELRRKLAMEKFNLDDTANEKDIEAAVQLYKEYEAECRKAGTVADRELDKLQQEWHKVEAAMEQANDALRASDMKVELAKMKAEAKKAAQEFVELKANLMSLTGSNAIMQARAEVQLLGEAADDTKGDIRQLDAALREGGNDAATAAAKFMRLQHNQQQLEERAQQLRIQMRELKATLDKPVSAHSLSEANTRFAMAKANLADVKEKAEQARGKVMGLEQQLAQIGKADSVEAVADIKRLEGELTEAYSDAFRLKNELDQAEDEFQAAHTVRELSKVQLELRQTEANARAVGSAMRGMSAKNWYIIRSVGTVLMSTITPVLSMGLQKIADASDTLDAAWRDMRKTVDGTEEDFQHLKDAAIEFSKTHVTTADQILEIEAMGGQLGIAVENLEAFGTTVANLDIATNMESDQIAEDLGKLANILGMSVDEYDNFGDSLVRLGNNEAALEGDIMRITTRFAGMGSIVGMSGDQVLAWATAATATGQKAEAAGSSMQRFISNMETAVMGGGDALDAWAKVAQMSAGDFKKAFEEDASGAMYKFVEGLAAIQKSGGSVNQTLMGLKITGVRDKQLLEGLAQQMVNATSDNNVLKDSLEMSYDAWNGISDKWGDAGDAMNEAEKKSQGFSGSLGKLKNTATALASSAGNSLVPWMDKLTETLGGVQEAYASLPEGSKQVINGIGAIVAAMGPMMMIVGAAGQGLTSFKKNLAENAAAALSESQAITVLVAQEQIDNQTMIRNELVKKRNKLATQELTAATRGEIAALEGEIAVMNSQIRAQEKAITKTKAMAGAMKALKTVGAVAAITAAIEVVMILAESYAEAKRRADLLTTSQAKMNEVFNGFDASNEVEEAEKATKSLKELQEAVDNAAKANIEMADNFNSSMQEAYDKSSNLDEIVTKIQTLSSQSELTETQVNDLRTAVNQLNEATGSEWMVTDEGKIMDQQRTMSELAGSMEALVEAYNKLHGTDYGIAEDGFVDADLSLQDLLDAVNELNGTDFVADAEGGITSLSGKYEDMAVEVRDVVAATNELKEAQDRLWQQEAYQGAAKEADENKRKSRTELEEAEKTLAELEAEAERIKGNLGETNPKYQAAEAAARSYRAEVEKLRAEYENDAKAAELWKSNQEGLEAAIANPKSIEAAITKFDELGEVLIAQDMGIDDMADAMKGLGLTFDDVANLSSEDVEKIADGWDGSMLELVTRLKAAGVEIDDTTLKMAELAEKSGIMAPKVSEMWDAFGGDVAKVQAAIELLNETGIDPKDVEFKDNTFVVKKHISDVNKQKIEDKGFKVDDGGSLETTISEILTTKAQLDSLDGKTASVKVSVDQRAIDAAWKTISQIFSKDGKTSTINVKANGARRATGAVVTRNARGRAFDGVISRPTMTNIGWVGEAGAEWVDAANGRVIPLTNRKYMVPIAREIAAGLNSYGGGRSVNVSVSLNYSAGSDANQMATDLTRALRRKILMEG